MRSEALKGQQTLCPILVYIRQLHVENGKKGKRGATFSHRNYTQQYPVSLSLYIFNYKESSILTTQLVIYKLAHNLFAAVYKQREQAREKL